MSRAWPVEGIEPDGTLAANARRILAVRVAEFYAHAPAVRHEEAVEALHDLRIAAKRLRYTLELFRAVFGETGERQIERIKAMQEDLGEIHDHDVRLVLVGEELAVNSGTLAAPTGRRRSVPPDVVNAADPRLGLLALRERERAARAARYRALVEGWDRAAAEGMRADLVGLSATPPAEVVAPARAAVA